MLHHFNPQILLSWGMSSIESMLQSNYEEIPKANHKFDKGQTDKLTFQTTNTVLYKKERVQIESKGSLIDMSETR